MATVIKKYQKVYNYIEELIKKGAIGSGEKIPSIRKTASHLKVSMMTVIDAYNRLEIDSLISSRPQSGYFVNDKLLWKNNDNKKIPKAGVDNISPQAKKVKQSDYVDVLFKEAGEADIIKFGGGLPDPSFFPSKELSRHMSRVVRNRPNGVNAYSLLQGSSELRQEICKQLIRGAVSCGPQDLIIVPGATAAIALSLKTVCDFGDTIAIESPGYFGFYSAAEFYDLSVVEVPSDPQTGICIDKFEEIAKKNPKIKALLLCSNNSNPTGATMPDENKEKLAEISAKYNITVLEDETYAELAFADHRNKSLKAFDDDNVISFGSFNKILAPGYRVGWIAPGKYKEELIKNFNTLYMSTPLANQLALASFLKEKGLVKHIRSIRKKYETNIELFKTIIFEHFPTNIKMSRPQGGHFLWIELPKGYDSESLAKETIKNNISIAPGAVFSAKNHHKRFFRINCACQADQKTINALKLLGKLIRKE